MNQTMLRQLLWIYFVFTLKIASSYILRPEFDQCDRPQCAAVDDILKSNVNFNIEPCDDFFNYACGKNFSRNAPLQFKYTNEDIFPGENQDLEQLRDILRESYVLSPQEQEIESLKTERDIYKRCKNGHAYNPREQTEYEYWLGDAARLDPDRMYNKTNDRWTRADIKWALEGFGFAFFDVDIVEREHTYDREVRRYIQISPTSDNVIDLNDLLTLKYMSKTSRRFNQNGNYDHKGVYSSLKAFIKELNQILPYEKYDDVDREDNIPAPMPISEWQMKYNQEVVQKGECRLEWFQILKEFFNEISRIYIQHSEHIIVKDENYFYRLAQIMCPLKKEVIEDYIYLRLVSKSIGLVDKEYREKYSIIPPVKGFENECTPGLLVGAAHAYTHKYFPKDNKETVEDIYKSVKGVIESLLGSDVYNIQATSNITRNFLRQLSKAEVVVGYPDWLTNATLVSNFYESFTVRDSYLRNQINVLKSLCKMKVKSLRDYSIPILDINTFFKSFNLQNIEFSQNLKQILLPVGIFSENSYKLLSAQLYDPINYGAAGTAIATELYFQWLSKSAYAQNVTFCISNQMPKIWDPVKKNEYIKRATAYLLGLHASYLAWPSKDSYPIEFERFGAVTDFKLFFLSFAESMCRASVNPSEDMSPHHFINFVVANLPEFTEAFRCFRSHVLNREKKCDPLKADDSS